MRERVLYSSHVILQYPDNLLLNATRKLHLVFLLEVLARMYMPCCRQNSYTNQGRELALTAAPKGNEFISVNASQYYASGHIRGITLACDELNYCWHAGLHLFEQRLQGRQLRSGSLLGIPQIFCGFCSRLGVLPRCFRQSRLHLRNVAYLPVLMFYSIAETWDYQGFGVAIDGISATAIGGDFLRVSWVGHKQKCTSAAR